MASREAEDLFKDLKALGVEPGSGPEVVEEGFVEGTAVPAALRGLLAIPGMAGDVAQISGMLLGEAPEGMLQNLRESVGLLGQREPRLVEEGLEPIPELADLPTVDLPPQPAQPPILPTTQALAERAETLGLDVTPEPGMAANVIELAASGGPFGLLGPARGMAGRVMAESLIGAGAGTGRTIAEEAGLGVGGQAGTELASSFGTAGVLNLLGRGGRGVAATGQALAPGLAGSERISGVGPVKRPILDIASEAARNMAIDPRAAAARLDLQMEVPMTTPEQTGDPGLLALGNILERPGEGITVPSATAATARRVDLEQARLESVQTQLAGGEVGAARQSLQRRKNELIDSINEDIAKSQQKTVEALESVGVNVDREILSQRAIDVVEARRSSLKSNVDDAWEKSRQAAENTPMAPETMNPIADTLTEISAAETAQTSAARQIPPNIRQAATDLLDGNVRTLQEVQDFRSNVLDEMRIARAGTANSPPNADRARKLNLLQRTALEVMETADTTGQLRNAIAESRFLSDVYDTGPMGRIRGLTVEGTERVSPNAAISNLISAGETSGDNLDALIAAGGDEARDAAEAALRNKFLREARDPDTGMLDVKAAQRFKVQNDLALKRVQGLSEQIDQAIDQAQFNINNIARRNKTKKGVEAHSQASLILGVEPSEQVRKVLNSREFADNPKRTITKYVNSGKSGAVGRAAGDLDALRKEGLVRSVMDEFLARATRERKSGDLIVNPAKFDELVQKSGITTHMTAAQRNRTQRIISRLKDVEKQREIAKGGGRLSLSTERPLVDLLARVVGARIGAGFGGKQAGRLQTAAAVSGFMRRIVSNLDQTQVVSLMNEAIYDPEIMKTLLMRPTKANDVVIVKRLRGHLANMDNDLTALEEDQ